MKSENWKKMLLRRWDWLLMNILWRMWFLLFIHRRGINLEVQVLLKESATVITYICCHVASHITMVIYLLEYTGTHSYQKNSKTSNFPYTCIIFLYKNIIFKILSWSYIKVFENYQLPIFHIYICLKNYTIKKNYLEVNYFPITKKMYYNFVSNNIIIHCSFTL